MAEPRVTIKRTTLELIRRLLEAGDTEAALEVCREALDDFRQQELRRCKDEVFRRFRDGRITLEVYRELRDLAERALR